MAEGLFGASMTSSTDSRGAFRTTVDVDSSRRQREATTVQLRKTKKEERLNRRRKLAPSTPAPQVSISADMPSIAEGLNSDDPAKQYTAAGKCRRMLSVEKNPPIDMVIEAGLVPRLVQLLSTESHPSLQFEAAWALTNVASGTSQHTQTVIDSGAVPVFVQLLSSNSKEVREQAIWALGNVAGDSARCRDLVLGSGALIALINLISPSSPITLLRNATWALSNLCRGKPPPEFQKVKAALPALAALLQGNDSEVLTDSCWGLSYLSDGPNEKIQCVIDSGVVGRCVELLGHPEVAVQTPALRTVGNIVTGDDSQTEEVLKTQALNFLKGLLSSEKKGIRKEACWTLSNITAGNSEQIQKVLDADIFPRLIKMLSIEQFEIQKEAVWAVSNATAGGSPNQVAALVKMGCVRPLCELLEVSDSKILLVALEGVENVLKAGAMDAQNTGGENIVARLVEECEGLDKIENLQTHHEKMVYAKATKILTNFYDTESEEAFEMNQGEMNFNVNNSGFNMQGGFK